MADKVNFEEALASLEDIVARLESGDATLEQSIDLFEKGMKNIKDCQTALTAAEKKIIALSEFEGEKNNA